MNQFESFNQQQWIKQLMSDYDVSEKEINDYIKIFPDRRLYVNIACSRRSRSNWTHEEVIKYLNYVKDKN